MANDDDKIVLKWYTIRRIRLTGEYVSGIIAGFGGGVAVTASLARLGFVRSYASLIEIVGLCVVSIGAFAAMRVQDR
jgi:hypothetical protein